MWPENGSAVVGAMGVISGIVCAGIGRGSSGGAGSFIVSPGGESCFGAGATSGDTAGESSGAPAEGASSRRILRGRFGGGAGDPDAVGSAAADVVPAGAKAG